MRRLGKTRRCGLECAPHKHAQTHTPASAEAQPSGGHRHQHRGSQRCNFEWRRHPLWASCRANYRIKALRRTCRLNGKKRPEAGEGLFVVVVVEGCRAQKKFGPKSGCKAVSAKAPKWRGRGLEWVRAGSPCVAPGAVRAASRPCSSQLEGFAFEGPCQKAGATRVLASCSVGQSVSGHETCKQLARNMQKPCIEDSR